MRKFEKFLMKVFPSVYTSNVVCASKSKFCYKGYQDSHNVSRSHIIILDENEKVNFLDVWVNSMRNPSIISTVIWNLQSDLMDIDGGISSFVRRQNKQSKRELERGWLVTTTVAIYVQSISICCRPYPKAPSEVTPQLSSEAINRRFSVPSLSLYQLWSFECSHTLGSPLPRNCF